MKKLIAGSYVSKIPIYLLLELYNNNFIIALNKFLISAVRHNFPRTSTVSAYC